MLVIELSKEQVWRLMCDNCGKTKIVNNLYFSSAVDFLTEYKDQSVCDTCYMKKKYGDD